MLHSNIYNRLIFRPNPAITLASAVAKTYIYRIIVDSTISVDNVVYCMGIWSLSSWHGWANAHRRNIEHDHDTSAFAILL